MPVRVSSRVALLALLAGAGLVAPPPAAPADTHRPVLHARHWVAITGKPLAATAGAKMFEKGGNAVDAAAAMLAATATMWDVLSWGGETQALIFDPRQGKVVGLNALGVAPSGATPEHFLEMGLRYPPDLGPLAAVTPGTPGGLMTMVAQWGRLSLAEVLAPAIELADGYPIEADTARRIRLEAEQLREWPDSARVLLVHPDDEDDPGPRVGQLFRQPELAATLRQLVAAEAEALAQGKGREEAIQAAYDRFYRGDIARRLVAAAAAQGALLTLQDLDRWRVRIEEPVKTTYKGIEVYKLTTWTQGPVMLQALNLLETLDLQAMGYNSARYVHALYQAMNLAYADRDFYYGDPDFPPAEPVAGLLSKEYAARRAAGIDWQRNEPDVGPGDPYPFQGEENPFRQYLEGWPPARPEADEAQASRRGAVEEAFTLGTTSIQAADAEGWVVSVTPSGGWVPAVIAGDTGVGLSQRMQSFVLDPAENPFNVVAPGKRPRVTLTPTLALRDGRPFLAFSVQGGDSQDQNLLQFFLDVVEWGMTVQEAAEAANVNSFQMFGSFRDHPREPGKLLLRDDVPPWVRDRLRAMGYELTFAPKTSGPITAILVDREHGTFQGAASDYGDDYGVAW
ncbi:MAG TPA: gamma-glutamyltransferase [Thermoanaerobaculia bacterium]|nr:gamma-glutamyltransferase [Thermoanaerobaculia bacterium]